MKTIYIGRCLIAVPRRRRPQRKAGIAIIAAGLFVLWMGFMFIDRLHF